METEKEDKNSKNKIWKPILLLTVIIVIIVLSRVFGLGKKLLIIKDWISGIGVLGYFVFILIYIGATIASLPGSPLTIVAGALFGSVMGVALVSVGATLGAGAAFLIGRYFARDATASWLHSKEKFRKLDNLTEEHGAIIVAITRLVPIFPFNLLNYGFGLTKIKFSTYLFWSWLCMLPGTALYVVGTDAIMKAIARGEIPWVLGVIVVVILALLGLVANKARQSLKQKEEKLNSKQGDSDG